MTSAVWQEKIFFMIGSERMLEYDEFRLQLQGMENNITELRDSL